MKKTLTTENIVLAYSFLKSASLKDVDSTGKFAVIKICKALRSIASDFEAFKADAVERLKDERFDEMQQKALKWQNEGEKVEYTDEEKIAINAYFTKYQNEINECLSEEAKKENDIEINALSEEQFQALIGANDWNVEQMMTLSEILTA